MPEIFDFCSILREQGLGGMTGAMLVGSTPFIAEARIWLRRFGGNVYTSLPYVVSCLHGEDLVLLHCRRPSVLGFQACERNYGARVLERCQLTAN